MQFARSFLFTVINSNTDAFNLIQLISNTQISTGNIYL